MGVEKESAPPGVSKRCPNCKKLTCSFDQDKTSIICSSCGYEVKLQI